MNRMGLAPNCASFAGFVYVENMVRVGSAGRRISQLLANAADLWPRPTGTYSHLPVLLLH